MQKKGAMIEGVEVHLDGYDPHLENDLLKDIRELIEASKIRVALKVNFEMTLLYWSIGERIQREILGEERAAYGKRIMASLSERLTQEYGRGFSITNLFHMVKIAEVFRDREILYSLSKKLSWTHFRVLIHMDDPLKREFYIQMCCAERWSVRTLHSKINGMMFERTAISKKPEKVIRHDLKELREEDRMSPDLVFRDPYFLDFLGLSEGYSERDLENAIIREIERFLLEIGTDFSFLARQKRITVDNNDYYMDLLFYHRRLRRLVVIDLKLRNFKAADKGQMELYLRWLDKYEKREGEESPIGLILCAGKSEEHVKLLQLEKTGIRVAEYLMELPPRELFQEKLLNAIKLAREMYSESTKGRTLNKKEIE